MKFCKDCKNIRPLGRCGRLERFEISLVTGRPENIGVYLRCDDERRSGKRNACRKEGIFFVDKVLGPTIPILRSPTPPSIEVVEHLGDYYAVKS